MRQQLYSTRSDVWSYGITVWEILSDGKLPYEGLTPTEVCIRVIRDDLRLSQPDACPDELYTLLMRMWASDDTERPSMKAIVDELEDIRELVADQSSQSESSSS